MSIRGFEKFWTSYDTDTIKQPVVVSGEDQRIDLGATALANLKAIPKDIHDALTLSMIREFVTSNLEHQRIFGKRGPIGSIVVGFIGTVAALTSLSLVALLPLTIAKDAIDAAVTGSMAGYRALFD